MPCHAIEIHSIRDCKEIKITLFEALISRIQDFRLDNAKKTSGDQCTKKYLQRPFLPPSNTHTYRTLHRYSAGFEKHLSEWMIK